LQKQKLCHDPKQIEYAGEIKACEILQTLPKENRPQGNREIKIKDENYKSVTKVVY